MTVLCEAGFLFIQTAGLSVAAGSGGAAASDAPNDRRTRAGTSGRKPRRSAAAGPGPTRHPRSIAIC